MTNNSTIQATNDFSTFFDKLWKNRNRVPLQVNNLDEDIEFLQNYYKNGKSYFVAFNTDRLIEPDFLAEIEGLISNGLKVDKLNGNVEFPIEYIKDNLTEGETSALKYHFKEVESRFNNNPLYAEHKELFTRFKEEYNLA